MRAVIIGAGNAGSRLAEQLCEEKHDVVVIDSRLDPLTELESVLDVMTIQGNGCDPGILEQAGISKADLIVGVTSRDEVNILACRQAAVFGVPQKVARLANPDYMQSYDHFQLEEMGIDLAINPRKQCAQDIYNLLKIPGAHEVIELLDGRVLAVRIHLVDGSPILGQQLDALPRRDILDTVRFIALSRAGRIEIPHGDTMLAEQDDIYVVGEPENIKRFTEWVSPRTSAISRFVIAGGGAMGRRLAQMLEADRQTPVIIDRNKSRCVACADELDRTLVINGNPLSEETLDNAGISEETAFIAATDDDQRNMIACLLAQTRGAAYTIAQISDPVFVPIINRLNMVDRAVSTHLSLINSILHSLRGKSVQAASLLHMVRGELLEIHLSEKSKWAGRQIQQITIPRDAIIATVLRGDEVRAPTGSLELAVGDLLVIFCMPKAVGKLRSI